MEDLSQKVYRLLQHLPPSFVYYSIHIGLIPIDTTADHRRDLISMQKVDLARSHLQLGVFISRTLWSWPSCIEEVIPNVKPCSFHLDPPSFKMIRKSHPLHQVWANRELCILEVHLKQQVQALGECCAS
jgi:hypothetical protein